MQGMMDGTMSGGMMWVMGGLCLLFVLLLALAGVALIKYLFFGGKRE